MSAKQPEIKFSPFEALLIGEKNRVLKLPPTKNTIFVTSLNQKSKSFDLRALFGPELNTNNSNRNDDTFKVPQSVHEYHNNESDKLTEVTDDTLDYGFKRHKTFVRSNDLNKPKYKKSNKVKFKEKHNKDEYESVINKVGDALKNQSAIEKFNLRKTNSRLSNFASKENRENNRYSLRKKITNYKYPCESEEESLLSDEDDTTIEEDYLSDYSSEFVVDNNKNIFNNGDEIENENFKKFQNPDSTDNMLDLSDPDIFIDEFFKYDYYRNGEFEFPKCPETELSDFDDNENLYDIIYENFPKPLKFESMDSSQDFIDALINADIIEPVEDQETILPSNESEQGEKLKVSCGTQTSCLDLPSPIDLSSCYHLGTLDNGYIATADGFVAIQNHLITDDNFRGLFINNPDSHNKNDLLVASFMKPLIHNTWVRSLQNF